MFTVYFTLLFLSYYMYLISNNHFSSFYGLKLKIINNNFNYLRATVPNLNQDLIKQESGSGLIVYLK